MNATGVKPAGQENPIAIVGRHVSHAPKALRQSPRAESCVSDIDRARRLW